MSLKMDQSADGVTPIPLPENPSNPMRTTRMESLKELIVRFEKRLRLWYRRHPSLDKSQRLSQRKVPSFCVSPASLRTFGLKLYNMPSGAKTEHRHVRFARRTRRPRTKP